MNINSIKESKFLKKEDCGRGILVTIREIREEDVGKDNDKETKHCLHFIERVKPMVLNITNARLIAKILGTEETDEWSGKQIVLYNEPNVEFAGELVGGIRVRAPKKQVAQAPAPSVEEDDPDNVPF